MQMPASAAKALKSATVALCWACVVPDFLDQCGSQLATAGDFTGIDSSQSDELADLSGATEKIEYEGSFSLPAEGADPFSRVSILRANAISLKDSHISSEMLQSLGELVQALIQEEAQNIQHQSDLWLISETKKAVDLLHNNPSLFPATGYSLHEGPNGVLFVKTDVPYWMVDAEAALRVIVQDVMSDVMQMTLPVVSEPPSEEKETDFPIEFGYDSTDRRSIKFAFGDSTVTVTCGKTLQLGGAVGVSHGDYTVKVESGNNSTEGTINAGPVAVHTSVAPDNVQHDVSVGTMQVMQARINPSAGPGSIVASYQDARIKFDTNPEGKRHGAEVGNKDFLIGVTRDFDDRINIFKHEAGQYSMQLETDLADDKNHAYSGKLTARTPQTGKVVFGGGFDDTNFLTTDLALEARDMSIAFNGKRGEPGYHVRIGPFVFDVVINNELPEFILREVNP